MTVPDDGPPILLGSLAGHALRAGGEAYLGTACRRGRCSTNVGHTVHQARDVSVTVAGEGHGVCECGVLSEHLHTGAARRRWHRQHKARAVLGQDEPAGQHTPVDPQLIA